MFVDTHCHLATTKWEKSLPEIVENAANHGVTGWIVPAIRPIDWQAVLAMLRLPETRAVALGVHPWFAQEWNEQISGCLKKILLRYPSVWLGEIGLDFLHDTPREVQVSVFRQQLRLAQELSRPVIIHQVRASSVLVRIIREEKFTMGGVIHAFSGSLEEAHTFIQLGFKIGIGILLLNSRAKKVRLAAQCLPLKDLLLETDSPFMLPEGQNSPANVRQIATQVATLRGISLYELAQQCEENLTQLMCSSCTKVSGETTMPRFTNIRK